MLSPCIIIQFKSPLNDDIRDALYATGAQILLTGQKRKKLKSGSCEGRVTTSFESVLLGALAGIRFEAIVEHEGGRHEVVYMVRENALRDEENYEDCFWYQVGDINCRHLVKKFESHHCGGFAGEVEAIERLIGAR